MATSTQRSERSVTQRTTVQRSNRPTKRRLIAETRAPHADKPSYLLVMLARVLGVL